MTPTTLLLHCRNAKMDRRALACAELVEGLPMTGLGAGDFGFEARLKAGTPSFTLCPSEIVGLMQEAGLAAPTLKVSDDFVTLTFALPATLAQAKNNVAPGKTLGKTPGKTPELILLQLATAPNTAIPELALQLGRSDSAIKRAIRKLRAEGKLIRRGPAKGGCLELI